jgi:hypothetical protein
VSSPEPDLAETCRILLKKAEEDATAVEVPLDREVLLALVEEVGEWVDARLGSTEE